MVEQIASTPDALMELATGVVSAYLGHNQVPIAEVPSFLNSVHRTLCEMSNGNGNGAEPAGKPAVAIKKSITNEFLICLEDGKKLRTLKRYLRSHHNLSPEEYRAKWGLPFDYPMVAPSYAKLRSEFAKKIGLGHSNQRLKFVRDGEGPPSKPSSGKKKKK